MTESLYADGLLSRSRSWIAFLAALIFITYSLYAVKKSGGADGFRVFGTQITVRRWNAILIPLLIVVGIKFADETFREPTTVVGTVADMRVFSRSGADKHVVYINDIEVELLSYIWRQVQIGDCLHIRVIYGTFHTPRFRSHDESLVSVDKITNSPCGKRG
jgi:hypothetical protein